MEINKRNSEAFLEIYNNFDNYLRKILGKPDGYRHFNLIDDLIKNNKSFS